MTDSQLAFQPITVGTMHLDHRLVVPPHSGGGGRLLESDEMFQRHCGYWTARVKGGVQWVGGGPTFVRNPLIPGFEPTGVGANGPGFFRHPKFVERMGEYMNRLHAAGGFGTVQFVLQGGMPIAPSPTLSGYSDHRIPHPLDLGEIQWLVREYGQSSALAAEAGADAIELHSNHDDVLQWFLSPLTNQRTDAYGGSLENRRRLVREVVEAVRNKVSRPITLGLRLCLDEMIDGGYQLDELQQIVAAFTADGTVDYFSFDVGGNWGAVSYIPPGVYEEGEWAELCGQAKQATNLPVVYVGRVFDVATAEQILADGHSDLVGFARATIADPEIVSKTRRGMIELVRPCVGVNDCIDRRVVEGLEFACAANPHSGNEHVGELPPVKRSRKVLVIGGGPAGTEFAALAHQRGHRVTLWERNDHLGGQLAIAAMARMNGRYGKWIDWQRLRLQRLGVDVELCHEATVEDIEIINPDIVVMATGARPRTIDAPGIDLPCVHQATDVLQGGVVLGGHVVVVSEDDRAAPLAVADHLTGLGHRVTVTYRTIAPSPLVGKYTIGAILARLDNEGATLVPMARLVGVEPGSVLLAHSYSNRRWTLDGVDSVVLACGAVPNNALFAAVKATRPDVHLLGDAYAPRRMVFATRQAYALAAALD
jgi:2,4-dienoyl-CoA reductase-like NADH-dependent reductase (Old Yellow Enzyme family)/threonine dehydrogenase-like Zn-dependent dehydrogenase